MAFPKAGEMPASNYDQPPDSRRRIMANAPLAVAASKRVIVEQRDWSTADMFERQEFITGHLLNSEDAREGATAFAERRSPVWKGQ